MYNISVCDASQGFCTDSGIYLTESFRSSKSIRAAVANES